jgi:hypothetical protein
LAGLEQQKYDPCSSGLMHDATPILKGIRNRFTVSISWNPWMVSGFSLLAHFLIPTALERSEKRYLVDLGKGFNDLDDLTSGIPYTMDL